MPLPGPTVQGSQVGAPDSSSNPKGCVQVEEAGSIRTWLQVHPWSRHIMHLQVCGGID